MDKCYCCGDAIYNSQCHACMKEETGRIASAVQNIKFIFHWLGL